MGSLASEEREAWLRAELSATGQITLAAASAALEVSEQTVRRHLRDLEDQGAARRVRGGAKAVGPVSFHGRARSHDEAKTEIARKTLPLVPRSGTIAFDSSTTMARLATLLPGADDLVVVTNGLDTLRALEGKPGIQPLLVGGRLDPRVDSFGGPLAARGAADFSYRTFFCSVAGLDFARGGFEDTLDEAHVKRVFLDAAESTVVGIDESKFGSTSAALSIPIDAIDVLATNVDADSRALQPMREHGSRVI
ncbi:DeoR/GlpR family DNA-binding transcription regulator [Microbacterium sp. G2-8]|uniref:DeoR/GlpR family DNA-binding transcription regulator n=1 Tax=Microbacterium sp. G2-8 TaxID=2842454 RepID=UPI001C8A6A61|nr:DeoR/GlpR family DNA-binding transcription regulator [Microbacterium sp. G2-8]